SAIGCSGRDARTRSRIASNGFAHSASRAPCAKSTMPCKLVLPGRAEAARAARALLERLDHVELDLDDGDHDELRDALERVHDEGLATAVPARHEHLALVVGIDQPDEVSEDDAVLMPEARAWYHDRRETRVAEVNGDARGHERRVAGTQRERLVDARAQV